jgi:hypothetical protein
MKMLKTSTAYNYLVIILLPVILAISSLNAYSQQPQVEEVNIVGSFTPTITDANKVMKNPVLPDTTISMPPLTYSIISRPLLVNFPVYTIDARKPDPENDIALLKNYIKAGFGNYITPYAEFFANKPQSKRSALGFHFKHLSSQGDIKDYGESSFSITQADFYGKYMSSSRLWKAGITYNRHMVHRYGNGNRDTLFNPTVFDTIAADSYRQVFNYLDGNIGFESLGSRGGALHHLVNLNMHYLSDRFEHTELNPVLMAGVDAETHWFGFSKSEKIGIAMQAELWANSFGADSSSSSFLVAFDPFFKTIFEEYELKVGLNASVVNDTATNLNIFPVIEGSLNIIPDILKIYGGIRGGVKRNSYKNLSDQNPFVAENVQPNFMKNKFEFYGGLNTSLGRHFDFNASVSGSKLSNMPFYYNDTTNLLRNTFAVVYDNGSMLKVNGEFAFQNKEKLFLVIGATYNTFETDSIVKPWHCPEIQVYVSSKVVIKNKFTIKARIDASGKSYAPDYVKVAGKMTENIPIELDGFADLSLGLEYHINKKFSVFADFNNLAGKNYQRWNGVPVFGINVLGGLTYSF